MKQQTIVLDFDETLFSTARQTRRFLNHRFGTQIPVDDTEYLCGHSLYDLVKLHAPSGHTLTEDVLYEVLGSEFLSSIDWHQDVHPIEGSQEVVCELAKHYNIYVATARQTTSLPVVKTLLEKFFPSCVQDIHFVWTHLGNGNFKGVPKKDFVQKLGRPSAYVDDNPKETREIHGFADHVLLFDPKAHHHDADDSHRVASWKEIEKLLLKTL